MVKIVVFLIWGATCNVLTVPPMGPWTTDWESIAAI